MIKTNYSVKLRNAKNSDQDILFDWANDIETRKWSFHSKPITKAEHKSWFKKKIIDKNVKLWIFDYKDVSSGSVRLEKDNGKIVIHYQISPEMRGKRLASRMLILAMNKLNKLWLDCEVLAFTYPDNIGSIKSLENAGFRLLKNIEGRHCYIFSKKNKIKKVRK